jgi:hypothetical protein
MSLFKNMLGVFWKLVGSLFRVFADSSSSSLPS